MHYSSSTYCISCSTHVSPTCLTISCVWFPTLLHDATEEGDQITVTILTSTHHLCVTHIHLLFTCKTLYSCVSSCLSIRCGLEFLSLCFTSFPLVWLPSSSRRLSAGSNSKSNIVATDLGEANVMTTDMRYVTTCMFVCVCVWQSY